MKRICLLLILIRLAIFNGYSQEMPPPPPPGSDTVKKYEKDPNLPNFKILLLDSSTVFNTSEIPKGKPILLVYFDPTCKHCQEFTKNLLIGMDSLKDVRIYMFSLTHDMNSLRTFYSDYNLADYKNIKVVGREPYFFYLQYYSVMSFPDIAVYDKHKQFVKHFSGGASVTELYKCTHPDKD